MKYKTVYTLDAKRVISRGVNLGGRPYHVTGVQVSLPSNTIIRLTPYSNVILIFAIDSDVEIDNLVVRAGCCQWISPSKKELNVSVLAPGACLLLQLPRKLDEYQNPSQTLKSGYYTTRCAYWIERIRIFMHKQISNSSELSGGVRQLLGSLSTQQIRPSVFSNREIAQLLQFELYPVQSDTPTTIANVTRTLGIKTYRLKLLLHEIYNCSAHKWLVAGKMNHALNLLQDKQLTLQFIASKTGYRLEENFIIAFRNYFGITPHAFRTRVRQLPSFDKYPH